MTDEAATARPHWAVSSAPVIYGLTVFASAALIFLVEPMMAKMVLPKLGGSPMVWNTSMAFFQAALLVGYLYAHLLQRVGSLRTQVLIHGAVVLVSALVLPLHVSAIMGAEPGSNPPALWLVGVLALSLGPPFAALSATAPLAQVQLGPQIDVYLDGGPSPEQAASTIVDLTGPAPRILREGPVTSAAIAAVLGVDTASLSGSAAADGDVASG